MMLERPLYRLYCIINSLCLSSSFPVIVVVVACRVFVVVAHRISHRCYSLKSILHCFFF